MFQSFPPKAGIRRKHDGLRCGREYINKKVKITIFLKYFLDFTEAAHYF